MATRTSTAKKSGALDPALPQKKRARRRLVGALAVCVLAAIVLPIVLDSEPRQIRDDVQVQIPSRDTPLNEPLTGTTRSGAVLAPKADAQAAAADAPREDAARAADASEPGATALGEGGADPKPQAAPVDKGSAGAGPSKPAEAPIALAEAKPESRPESRPEPRPEAKGEPKSEAKAEPPLELKPDPAATGKADPKAAGKADAKAGQFVVQIGAFASEKGASEQLQRARSAGLKAYTEKVKTPGGERIRVRVGPFASREAAEQARTKLRGLGVESTLIAP